MELLSIGTQMQRWGRAGGSVQLPIKELFYWNMNAHAYVWHIFTMWPAGKYIGYSVALQCFYKFCRPVLTCIVFTCRSLHTCVEDINQNFDIRQKRSLVRKNNRRPGTRAFLFLLERFCLNVLFSYPFNILRLLFLVWHIIVVWIPSCYLIAPYYNSSKECVSQQNSL
jgi:hypothetical protein